jgi:hypothetical protein
LRALRAGEPRSLPREEIHMTFEPAQEGQRTTVVVYDRTTGEIIHVHEVLTERGGRHPSQKSIE